MITISLKKMLKFISGIWLSIIQNIPGELGYVLRRKYWSKRFKSCGNNLRIDVGVVIEGAQYITIGDNVWIDKYSVLIAGPVSLPEGKFRKIDNPNYKYDPGELVIGDNIHIAPFCVIQAHGGVYIGSNSGLASGVKIYSLSNVPADPNDRSKIIHFSPYPENAYFVIGPIHIDMNVGIALNSVILPGVSIGANSFVAPFSLVISNFPENSYISGYPAKRVGKRFS